jgi:hypothetical protein
MLREDEMEAESSSPNLLLTHQAQQTPVKSMHRYLRYDLLTFTSYSEIDLNRNPCILPYDLAPDFHN